MEGLYLGSFTEEGMRSIAKKLGALVEPSSVIMLEGGLGAGKTTFAQGMALGCESTDKVTSPTFNIVHEYRSGRIPLFHMDLYRIEDPDALYDIDFDYYVDDSSEGTSIIEWGSLFPDEMPEDRLEIHFELDGPSKRRIGARALGERSAKLLGKWAEAL